jgi:hypothetical protein
MKVQEKKEEKRERKKDSPYPRKRNKGEMFHEKEFIHPSTVPTHMHIFIKVYDFFLPWIRFLTSNPPYLQLHKIKPLGEKERHNKSLGEE